MKADKLRAAALHVSNSTTGERLLMFAEDCEDQALREINGKLVIPR